MLDGKKVYAILLKYIDDTLEGAGALKGASCQIQSITEITGGHRITFAWELNDGTSQTSTLDVMNGAKGEDGAQGADGADGVGIASIEKTSTSGLVDTYTITYTDGDTDTFTVTNGKDGEDGSQVSITQIQISGTKIAEVDIDGTKTELYAPSGGGGGSDYSSEIASLSTENSLQTSEISSLSAENSTQSSEIDSLSTASSEQAGAIDSMSQSMSEIASTAGSLSTENSQQSSQLSSLSTENSTQTSELSSLSTENSTQTSEISSLSTAQSELGSEVDVIGSEVAEREMIPTTLSSTLLAGNTTVTFSNVPTSGNNTISVYTSKAGLDYTSVDDSVSGELTYTFEAQSSDITVYLVIREVS